MLIEIKKVGVSAKGKDISIGEKVETDEKSARSLIADGYAVEAVAENALKSPVNTSTLSGDKLPAGDSTTQGDAENGAVGAKNEVAGTDGENGQKETDENRNAEAELVKIKSILNDRYKRDELYDAAIKAGVEIAYDAKKADIIGAVVAQGKAESLLK